MEVNGELQDMFERVMVRSTSEQSADPASSVPPSPTLFSAASISDSGDSTDSYDNALRLLSSGTGPRSTPGTTIRSFIPRATMVSQRLSQPLPPTRSLQSRSGSQVAAVILSPELSFDSFTSGGDGDGSGVLGGLEDSLLDMEFNFDEFVVPGDLDVDAMNGGGSRDNNHSSYLALAEDEEDVDPVVSSSINAASPTLLTATLSNGMTTPFPSPLLPISTSMRSNSTLGEHNKSLLEEVLCFVAASHSTSTADLAVLAVSASCSSGIALGQSSSGMNGLGMTSSGSLGEVVMTSPVLVR